MADITIATETPPGTPSGGNEILYVDSVSKQLCTKDDAGKVNSLGGLLSNFNTADVTASAADTYLAGSSISIPAHKMQVGTIFKWRFAFSKTAAGIATPIWSVRVGTAGTVSDTARLTFTGTAQTAVVDNGYAEIIVVVRSIGASGVIA